MCIYTHRYICIYIYMYNTTSKHAPRPPRADINGATIPGLGQTFAPWYMPPAYHDHLFKHVGESISLSSEHSDHIVHSCTAIYLTHLRNRRIL